MASRIVEPANSADAPFHRRQWLVVLAATLVGAALRLLCLGEWSLWIDEAHTWRDATMPLDGENGFLATQRAHYPLPFFLLRFLFGVGALGFDEWQVRLPFAFVGIATVPTLAVCGRRLVGRWPAVYASVLLALNPWHIFWSQNARGYGMMILASVLAIHRLHVFSRSHSPWQLILGMFFVAVGMASHSTAALLVLGFVGFVVVRHLLRPPKRHGAVKVLVLAGVVLLPLPWLIGKLGTSWSEYNPFSDFVESKSGNLSLAHWFETFAYYFRPGILLCAGVALLLAPKLVGRARTIYLSCLVLVPVVVLTAVGGQLAKVTARYAICILPVLTLLTGMLIHELAQKLRDVAPGDGRSAGSGQLRWLALLLPALVLGDYVRLDVAYFTEQFGARGRYREAAAFLREQVDARGFDGLRLMTVHQPVMRYYLRRRHWFGTDGDPYPTIDVHSMEAWRWQKGELYNGARVHEPGAENHFAWHQRGADVRKQMFAVLARLPEMREKDTDGSLEKVLRRDFELALHLPVWVGPKDESIFVFLPKQQD